MLEKDKTSLNFLRLVRKRFCEMLEDRREVVVGIRTPEEKSSIVYDGFGDGAEKMDIKVPDKYHVEAMEWMLDSTYYRKLSEVLHERFEKFDRMVKRVNNNYGREKYIG